MHEVRNVLALRWGKFLSSAAEGLIGVWTDTWLALNMIVDYRRSTAMGKEVDPSVSPLLRMQKYFRMDQCHCSQLYDVALLISRIVSSCKQDTALLLMR